jgi:hypothetical protein
MTQKPMADIGDNGGDSKHHFVTGRNHFLLG